MPPAGEPQSGTRRGRNVRAVPVPANRHHQAEGHRRPRHVRRARAPSNARSDLAPARTRVRLPRRKAHSHLPPRLSAAEPFLEARSLGGHETGEGTVEVRRQKVKGESILFPFSFCLYTSTLPF